MFTSENKLDINRFNELAIKAVKSRLEKVKELQDRTKRFAVPIVQFFSRLPHTEAARVIGRQLLRAGTAVAANYRAACRARSAADFISKMSIVLEEADETLFWLELLVEAGIIESRLTSGLSAECPELQKLIVNSLNR
jgi:four helix bundle protein